MGDQTAEDIVMKAMEDAEAETTTSANADDNTEQQTPLNDDDVTNKESDAQNGDNSEEKKPAEEGGDRIVDVTLEKDPDQSALEEDKPLIDHNKQEADDKQGDDKKENGDAVNSKQNGGASGSNGDVVDVEAGAENQPKVNWAGKKCRRAAAYAKGNKILVCVCGVLAVLLIAAVILLIYVALSTGNPCFLGEEEEYHGHENGEDSHVHGDELHVTYLLDKDYNLPDGEDVNLAAGKNAYMSWDTQYPAGLAVDNNTSNVVQNGDCAQTGRQVQPVWYVDLGESYLVSKVKLILPSDCCVGELHDFEIRVGENEEDLDLNTQCRHYMGTALEVALDITCTTPTTGRYVSIQMLGNKRRRNEDVLTLCEVMVYSN